MKILRARIIFESGDISEFEGGTAIDLAHKLIDMFQLEIEVEITQDIIDQFIRKAAKAFVASKSAWNADEFTKLYVEKEIEKFKLIERQLKSQHEIITAYEAKINELKQQLCK